MPIRYHRIYSAAYSFQLEISGPLWTRKAIDHDRTWELQALWFIPKLKMPEKWYWLSMTFFFGFDAPGRDNQPTESKPNQKKKKKNEINTNLLLFAGSKPSKERKPPQRIRQVWYDSSLPDTVGKFHPVHSFESY